MFARPVGTPSSLSAQAPRSGTDNHRIIDKSSTELHGTHATTIGHMLQVQLLVLLTFGVEIDATDTAVALVEANVVETLEARTRNRLNAMVGHQEVFFPAHENMLALLIILQREGG